MPPRETDARIQLLAGSGVQMPTLVTTPNLLEISRIHGIVAAAGGSKLRPRGTFTTGDSVETIQPVELPETATIIGDHWPQQDETAYAREAENQRVAANQAAQAAATARTASNYTEPAFRGNSGTALTDRLDGHHGILTDDQARHTNIASWLDLGQQNVIQAKAAMNLASVGYHKAYEHSTIRAVDESWPQRQLSQVKAMLIHRAQSHVVDARTAFDIAQQQITNGIIAGVVPNLQLSRPVGDDEWDHIDEIIEHWNRTSNAGLPAMPDPYPPEF
ncbi:hypothetical protein B5P44_00065 [Mycobacterium sp. CBMA 213]|uniref:Uncharacterized protein n=1 Tax=Mycolicibacterium sp. CBMA 213 TaxID=1968788 RepID=A0A343VQY5_9MYCO|nr:MULTISPECIES: hypothetical protein [unclassified Mycolicibacterium]AVN58309.1 hypothetical protein B5P44_p00014 [Mycolicibacterium sp. CBMA 213]MUL60979.1 hypothetical protein [Mycolicibacterium sp. CBMA 335]MUM03217.1 hypothetical protein [Mycolicibacterium sp. CBMA 213]